MRRMITTKQAKALDNIVVNEDGTIVEIGGNVGFEGIEQIGTTNVVHIPATVSCKKYIEIWDQKTLVTGIETKTGNWYDGGPAYVNEGTLMIQGGTLFVKIGGQVFNTSNGSNITVSGSALAVTADGEPAEARGEIEFVPAHDETIFKPFYSQTVKTIVPDEDTWTGDWYELEFEAITPQKIYIDCTNASHNKVKLHFSSPIIAIDGAASVGDNTKVIDGVEAGYGSGAADEGVVILADFDEYSVNINNGIVIVSPGYYEL